MEVPPPPGFQKGWYDVKLEFPAGFGVTLPRSTFMYGKLRIEPMASQTPVGRSNQQETLGDLGHLLG